MTEKMDVLEIVLPVLVMIILGMLCRKWKLLDQNGVNENTGNKHYASSGNFSCACDCKIQWKDWNIGADHVHNASDFIWRGIPAEEIYGRTL